MGRWGLLEGLVYNLPIEQRVKELPDRRKIHRWIAGLDFGFNHPTALVILGIRNDIYYQYEDLLSLYKFKFPFIYRQLQYLIIISASEVKCQMVSATIRFSISVAFFEHINYKRRVGY